MKQKKGLLMIALAFAVLLGGAYALYDRLSEAAAPQQLAVQVAQPRQEEVAEPTPADEEEVAPEKPLAPPFAVYDAEGQEVFLSHYRGKPVVLNFWASWCGPCQSEMPAFQEKYEELGEEIHFLMINVTTGRETMETADAFIEENGYTFPVLYDTRSDAVTAYGAYALPSTYFIDAEGYGIVQAAGAIDAETLQRGIDMIS
jgi:thiol-disulfide isomerase/thioredoxin